MKPLKKLRYDRDKLIQKLSSINKQILEYTKDTLVQCTKNNYGAGCGMGFKIRYLEYIQTYWYEGPHGCTGGDNWHSGEGQFICPHCQHLNRLYDRSHIEDLKHLFASVTDKHDD